MQGKEIEMAKKNSELLEGLLEELHTLQKSHELLESLFLWVGPYKDRPIPDELWFKIRDHFDFDDSE